jgi:hypothetical protein
MVEILNFKPILKLNTVIREECRLLECYSMWLL